MTAPTLTLLAARRELYAATWPERRKVLLDAIAHANTLAARLDPHQPDQQLADDLVRQLDAAKVAAMRAGQTARATEGV